MAGRITTSCAMTVYRRLCEQGIWSTMRKMRKRRWAIMELLLELPAFWPVRCCDGAVELARDGRECPMSKVAGLQGLYVARAV